MRLTSLGIGIRDYLDPQYDTLDSAANSVGELQRCLNGFDNVDVNAICSGSVDATRAVNEIRDVARTSDYGHTLLIVVSSHGEPNTGHVVCTDIAGRVAPDDVANAVYQCKYANIVVIIDACYSGDFAIKALRRLDNICPNVVVMASSSPGQLARATPGPDGVTLFVKAFVDVIEAGIPDMGDMLDAYSVGARMRSLLRGGLQRPYLAAQSSLDVHLVPNRLAHGSPRDGDVQRGLLMVFDPGHADEADQLADDLAHAGGPEVTLLAMIGTGGATQLATLINASQYTMIVLPSAYNASEGWSQFARALARTGGNVAERTDTVPILLGDSLGDQAYGPFLAAEKSIRTAKIHDLFGMVEWSDLRGSWYQGGVEHLASKLRGDGRPKRHGQT